MSRVSTLLGDDFELTPESTSEPFYYPGEREYEERRWELSKYTLEELEAEIHRRSIGKDGVMVNTKQVLKQWQDSLA